MKPERRGLDTVGMDDDGAAQRYARELLDRMLAESGKPVSGYQLRAAAAEAGIQFSQPLVHPEDAEDGEISANVCEDRLIEDEPEQQATAKKATGTKRTLNIAAERLGAKAVDAEPGHTVCAEVGDANSRAGSELLQRFGRSIGCKMPLHGVAPSSAQAVCNALLSYSPWAEQAAKMIAAQVALASLSARGGITIRPLLIVGPPGSGKSQIISKAAEVIGVPSRVIPCGGSADSIGLQATARGWSTNQPSALFMVAHEMRSASPMVVLDEVDKSVAIDGKNGSVSGSLISLLSNPSSYYDDCLLSELDLSRFSIAMTVNSLKPLPSALIDRFTVIELPRPRKEHFDLILGNALEAEAADLGIPSWALPELDTWDRNALLELWMDAGRSLRVVKRGLHTILSAKTFNEVRRVH